MDASAAIYLELSSNFHLWSVSFIRAAQDWVDVLVLFFNLLYSLRLSQGGEDKLRWALFKRGMLTIRSFYNVLVPHDSTPFPWKCIWRSKVPLSGCSLLRQPP
jgi:hypothetical protein